ncbi:MAG: LacI family transcriptional regulator [Clostridiales bacterium]|nr:LacI family transcriptional regulator [Clostridiales bacterium]MDY4009739.1 LacI family DNA-binding transcriptional regulator [Candidatus Limiplasma sp.]
MTIREIATIAGVSPAAVSLVINNKKGVSEETRRRVMSVVEECGYVAAPQKKKGERFRLMVIKYRAHGIALEENQGFIASIIDRIESECRRFAFDLIMCNCEAKTAETTIRELMQNPPDGVILIGTELREADYPLLRLFTVPVVVLDNNIVLDNVDSVVMDNRHLMQKTVRYLYELGYRDIGYFKFNLPVNNCDERYEGYLEELGRLGLTPPEPVYLNPTVDGACEDMKNLIKSGSYVPHGAAVADNDTVVIGAVKAIREAGYSIPEDLSVVGFDDIPFSAVTMPALTTMRISRSAMGTLAVDMIRKRIKHPDWPGMHMQIGGKLIVRNSTRPVDG